MPLVDETAERIGAAGVAQFAQGLGFDLADTLAGDVELFADLFEGVVGVHADAETHAQDLGLAGGQAFEDLCRDLAQTLDRRGVGRGDDVGVFDEVAEMRVFVVADRGLHGNGLLGDLEDLEDLLLGHVHALGQFFRRGLAAQLLKHLTRNAVELVDGLDHMHRNTDGAGLVGDRARDGLTNPPGGIG